MAGAPGVKTVLADEQETLSLIGSAPKPIPAYWSLSFNNDPNFMLTPVDGVFPETPGYLGGIIIPDPNLTSITNDVEFEDPAAPGAILEIPLTEGVDYLADPADNKVLQIALRKPHSVYVLNETVNRAAIYTADDILIYIIHFFPTYFTEDGVDLFYRQDYLSEVTLEGLKAGDIDKQVMADVRITAITEDIARLQGLEVDYTVGSTAQVNEFSATKNISEIDTLSGKVYILEGDHAVGTKTLTDIEFSRHYLGNLDLTGGAIITLAGKANGKIKVINAADNSVLVTADCDHLIIDSDNEDCLVFTGTGTVILNGNIVSAKLYGTTEADNEADAAHRRETTGGSGWLKKGDTTLTDFTPINGGGIFTRTVPNASFTNAVRMAGLMEDSLNGYLLKVNRLGATQDVYFPPAIDPDIEATTTTTQDYSKTDWIVVDNQAYICIADSTSGALLTNTTYFEPRDEVARQDLWFREFWQEDVTIKDFIFLDGNVHDQTTNCPTTGLALVTADFTGYDTYSLNGNWQPAGTIVAKGHAWSTLSAKNKTKINADKGNWKIFIGDNGNPIQNRKRERVIQGLGNEWGNFSPSLSPTNLYYALSNDFIKPKGNLVSITSDFGPSSLVESYYYAHYSNALVSEVNPAKGVFVARGPSTIDYNIAYKGRCFVLPIVLVQRDINQKAWHPTYNPEGSALIKLNDVVSTWDAFNNTSHNLLPVGVERNFGTDAVDRDAFVAAYAIPVPGGSATVSVVSNICTTSIGSGSNALMYNNLLTIGKRYRKTINISAKSGTWVAWDGVSNIATLTTGENTIEWVAVTDDIFIKPTTSGASLSIDAGTINNAIEEVSKDEIQSLSDCITYADPDSGAIADAISGNPFGFYHDEIRAAQFVKDLRKDSNLCDDMRRYMELQSQKANAGEMRGSEPKRSKQSYSQTISNNDGVGSRSNFTIEVGKDTWEMSQSALNWFGILLGQEYTGGVRVLDLKDKTGNFICYQEGIRAYPKYNGTNAHPLWYDYYTDVHIDHLDSKVEVTNCNTTIQLETLPFCNILGDPINYARAFGKNIAEDDCQDDDTADWAKNAGTNLDFDTDHYELGTTGGAGNIWVLKDLLQGRIYQITIDLKDGTETSYSDLEIKWSDGSFKYIPLPTTTSSFKRVSVIFIPDNDYAGGLISINCKTDMSGNNIEFKYFTVDDIIDMVLPGTPLLVHDTDGSSLLPVDVVGNLDSQGHKQYKLSRKFLAGGEDWELTKVFINLGQGFTELIYDHNNANVAAGTHYYADSDDNELRLDEDFDDNLIVLAFYETKANFLESADNAESLVEGEVQYSNSHLDTEGGRITYAITGKVPVNSVDKKYGIAGEITGHAYDSDGKLLTDSDYTPKHELIALNGVNPAAKYITALGRENGIAYLYYLFKEMRYGYTIKQSDIDTGYIADASYTYYKVSGGSWTLITAASVGDLVSETSTDGSGTITFSYECWGDSNEFEVGDDVSLTQDLNDQSVLFGTKRVELDAFIGDKE